MRANLDAEVVAYWYLRLNGFLLLRNVLLHGDQKSHGTRTEIDVLGVRFRHRRELRQMMDDEWIEGENRTIVVLCDAKRGAEDFNKAWTNRRREVMESALAFVGVIPQCEWSRVAGELYDIGRSEWQDILITLLLIHHDPDHQVSRLQLKSAKQIQIEHASRFIHKRFSEWGTVKTDHNQWEPSGQRIWDLYYCTRGPEDFVKSIMREIGCAMYRAGPDDKLEDEK
jgi:hypothetical protein